MSKRKNHNTFKIIAIVAAVIGALVAVAMFFKRKADELSKDLDFNGDLLFEDDDYLDDDDALENADVTGPSAEKADDGQDDGADPAADDSDKVE